MSSLSGRLLLFVSLLLIMFFGLTIFAFDMVFRDLSKRSLRELLDAQLIALIAVSDADDQGRVGPSRPLGDPRFSQPGSGLYAEIRTAEGELLWRSASALGADIDFGAPLAAGERRLQRMKVNNEARGNSQLMVLSAGIDWELQPGADRHLIFSVGTSLGPYKAQLHRFRVQLFSWFSGLMALLLIALAFLLRLVLAPLRRIEREIREVESGARDQLGTSLPSELVGLATNTNALLASERKRVERYRNTLGNLAHSLKTPLAVIRSSLSSRSGAGDPIDAQIDQQIDRMNTIVQHQLKRASTSGAAVLGRAAVEVRPILVELRAALSKAHAHKDLLIEIEAADDAVFAGDRGDLLELVGNLLDNACKWCRGQVRIAATRAVNASGQAQLQLTVEDDGQGIDPADRERILERGVRADERTSGQGIGLAMVREIVEIYDGRIEIASSELGGARITIRLPAR